MRHLFGTDGMRGEAGKAPLDVGTLYRLGRALAFLLRARHGASHVPAICLGRDTRESCSWIESALGAGVRDGGGTPISAGVLPTPALALITREGHFDAALMVSASHNPYQDNGVKVLDHHGTKLPDAVEAALEARMAQEPAPQGGTADEALPEDPRLVSGYLHFLERCLDGVRLDGMRVVLDAAHGAAYRLGPEAFRRAGATVTVMGDAPDGRNINEGVGSLHPELVAARVVETGADLGFAFDGDADRCIGASPRGSILDGDFTLYYAGRALARRSRLPGSTVVATVMSNLGLQKALEAEGVRMLRAPVGDRYVLEAMREGGYALGGEQSGHVIFMDHAPSGDGILTALTVASLARSGAGDVDEALARIPRFPQVLRNVRVKAKPRIDDHPALAAAVRRAEEAMGADGRVVVRYSGTEPKARVMIEGVDEALVHRLADEVLEVFQREIGE